MEYTKLIFKIAKMLEVEYIKIAEIEANIKDSKLGLEIQESVAETAIKNIAEEIRKIERW